MSKTKQQKKALEALQYNPSLKQVYTTSDNQPFVTEASAKHHVRAASLRDKKITCWEPEGKDKDMKAVEKGKSKAKTEPKKELTPEQQEDEKIVSILADGNTMEELIEKAEEYKVPKAKYKDIKQEKTLARKIVDHMTPAEKKAFTENIDNNPEATED